MATVVGIIDGHGYGIDIHIMETSPTVTLSKLLTVTVTINSYT